MGWPPSMVPSQKLDHQTKTVLKNHKNEMHHHPHVMVSGKKERRKLFPGLRRSLGHEVWVGKKAQENVWLRNNPTFLKITNRRNASPTNHPFQQHRKGSQCRNKKCLLHAIVQILENAHLALRSECLVLKCDDTTPQRKGRCWWAPGRKMGSQISNWRLTFTK